MVEVIYAMFLYSALIVFIVAFLFMLFKYVIPTWRAKDDDKRSWKISWNHVEIVALVMLMIGAMTAIQDATTEFSRQVAQENQELAESRRERAYKFASQVADFRCNPPAQEVGEICRLIQKLMDTREIDADAWADLSDAFTRELEAAESTGPELEGWVRTEAMNLAIASHEIAEFAATRDELALTSEISPIPEWALMFWPHMIALGFALRFAKVLATYSLL